jgi:Spy/CpxP family protein refolding chaperone
MFKVRFVLWVSFVALVFSGLLMAEDKPAKGQGGPTVDQMLERLSTELSLTEDQKPKVKAIVEDAKKKRDALKDETPEDRKEKSKAIIEEQMTKMKAVLTAEQQIKYQKMVEEMKNKKGEGKKKPDDK